MSNARFNHSLYGHYRNQALFCVVREMDKGSGNAIVDDWNNIDPWHIFLPFCDNLQ